MAKNKNSSYTIELDVTSSAASKQVLKEFQATVKATGGDIDALSKQYISMAGNVKDIATLEKQYNTVVEEQLKLKDKEIDKLEAKKVAIAANIQLSKDEKAAQIAQLDSQIKQLNTQKQFIKAKQQETKLLLKTDGILKKYLKSQNQIIGKAAVKNWQQTKENVQAIGKAFVSIGRAIKNIPAHTVAALTKIPAALTYAIRKAPKAAGKAIKYGAIGAVGIAGAIMSAGIAGAEGIQEKEKALSSLKSGINPDIVDKVFVQTGAGYPEIVAALNNLSDLTKDGNELIAASQLELQYPGMGHAIITSSKNTGNLTAQQWQSTIAQIKKQTGTQDLTPALEAAKASRLVTRGDISQQQYLQAYSALASKGLDTEVIDRIIRHASTQGGNFLDNLNNLDLTKFVRGQDKQRLQGDKLNLTVINPDEPVKKTNATSIVERMRELQLMKDKILVKLLPLVDSILSALDRSGVLDKLGTAIARMIPKLAPLIEWLGSKFITLVQHISDAISWILASVETEEQKKARLAYEKNAAQMQKWFEETAIDNLHDEKLLKELIDKTPDAVALMQVIERAKQYQPTGGMSMERAYSPAYYTPAMAQGGVAKTPSLCGEAGPELVIPLDNSRSGRANQIIQNFNTNQSFNMQSNQQTPLAFAQSVGRNPFVRRFAFGN